MKYDLVKIIIESIISSFLLFIFWPLMILTALWIKMVSPAGPVFADTPKRVGKGGKRFYPYKFRSMIPNAHKLIRTDPKLKKLYAEYKRSSYKLHDDPRLIIGGQFIRKFSIDEIPQLLNVLKGEMALIGPRPYYPDELEEQQQKFPETKKYIDDVLSVSPGITGMWQVSGRSNVNFDKRIALDAYYAKNKNFWMDLVILLKTPWAMVSGKGAV